ncbi:MAG: TIGR03943 family protein [Cyanobacteria bacterium]|nr:TIGR03943 family protein [Cyanobacteriota bacterium]
MLLVLWAVVLLRSSADGRLDLLLRASFHPLVALAGLLLLALALVQLRLGLVNAAAASERASRRQGLLLLVTAALTMAVVALPPAPSFADLAGQRPRDDTAAEEMNFVLPPAQRSLTDWVRLLRSQPDPDLFAGDPVRISGFVLPMAGGPPQIARLLVRCCLADAAPVGLPVRWPGTPPAPDQWLRLEGRIGVEDGAEGRQLVILPSQVTLIPRPARPLEP